MDDAIRADKGLGRPDPDLESRLRRSQISPVTLGYTAQLGLASLVLGAVLFLAAPNALIFGLLLGREHLRSTESHLAVGGVILGLLLVAAIGVAGILFGIRGLLAASVAREPSGLSVAGTILNAAALVLWLVVAVALIMVLGEASR